MLVLPAELTHAQARRLALLRQARAAEPGPRSWSTPRRWSASILGPGRAAGLRRSCRHAGHTLLVRGLAPRLRTLAGLYGVDALLPDAAPAA
jgi:hypothetical protein